MSDINDLDILKASPKEYEKISSSYHTARFGNTRGKYDLYETIKVTSELYDELGLDLEGMHVLDVGCGTGKISLPLAKRKAEVTCLDASMGMLKQYLMRAVEKGLDENIHLINASADAIPFKPGTFDMVVSSRFLHLFPISYYPALIGEMLEVVKPGGFIMLEIKNKYYGGVINLLKDTIKLRRRNQAKISSRMSLSEVVDLPNKLAGAQFVVVKACQLPKAHIFPLESKFSSFLRYLSRTLFSPVAGFFFVVIKKEAALNPSPLEMETLEPISRGT